MFTWIKDRIAKMKSYVSYSECFSYMERRRRAAFGLCPGIIAKSSSEISDQCVLCPYLSTGGTDK